MPHVGSKDDFDRLDPALHRRFLPDIAHRTTAEFLYHPKFSQIRRRYVFDTSAQYTAAVFPGGRQSTAYRVITVGALISQYQAWNRDDRETYPTLIRLKRSVSIMSHTSARQIDEHVARLVQTGYVALERTEIDGRLRLLQPTDKLLAWESTRVASYYGILDALYPNSGYAYAARRNPAFLRAQHTASTSIFGIIGNFLRANSDLLPFLSMNAGGLVLMHLAVYTDDERDRMVPKDILDFFEYHFRVSRSHLRNIIITAEAADILVRSKQKNKLPALTPRGHAAIDRFIADTLASHDLTYRMALMELGKELLPRPRERVALGAEG